MKKLSLRQLNSNELEKREMNQLSGGGNPGDCRCGCGGPSSTDTNQKSNTVYGYTITVVGGDSWLCSCYRKDVDTIGEWN